MHYLKRILIGAVLVIAIALTVTSCDTVMSILGRTDQTQNFYLAAKQIYDEARADDKDFVVRITCTNQSTSDQMNVEYRNGNDALAYNYNDQRRGIFESIIYVGGKMYYSSHNGSYLYDATKVDVVDYVDRTTAMRLMAPIYTCDYPATWFDGVEVTDNGMGGYILVNISSDMASQHTHPEMFRSDSTCQIYLNTDGSFSHISLSNIVIEGDVSDVELSFEWGYNNGIREPDNTDAYLYCGAFTSGTTPGSDPQMGCDHSPDKIKEITTQPTCTTSGYVKYVCECGEIRGETVLVPTAHNIVNHGDKPSTCTERGWLVYETCTKCDYEFKIDSELAPHDFLYGYCQVCGEPEPYSTDVLVFTSNDDGTCYVSYCSERSTIRDIIIPPVSPDGEIVTGVGEHAFHGNTFIRSVLIPDTVTTLSNGSFVDALLLERVFIGSGVAYISEFTFAWCPNLVYIDVDDDNPYYKDIDGHLYSKDGKTFLQYATGRTEDTYTVRSGVEYIHNHAFAKCESLVKVTLPSSLKELSIYLFNECRNLEHVNIPDGITEIPDGAFAYCESLRQITIPSSVTMIGGGAFTSCLSLTSVVIPYGVTTIEWRAFQNCIGITEIVIPDSVTYLGEYAFDSCISLSYLRISSNITVIPPEAFRACWSLTTVIIPSGVVTIKDKAFEVCNELRAVVIPASVEVIGDEVFNGCTKLDYVFVVRSFGEVEHGSLNYPLYSAEYYTYSASMPQDGGKYWHYVNGVPVIWDVYYNGAGYSAGLTYVSNGDGTCYVKDAGSFTGSVLTIPSIAPNGDTVTAISASAFEGCLTIKTVIIPDTVKIIGERAFALCTNLNDIIFGSAVESIGEEAFLGCTSLTGVRLGNSVKAIGARAFMGCESLVSAALGSGIVEICEHTFDGCTNLTSVSYGNGVKRIGDYAFRGCDLWAVVIGNGVQTIGKHAFENCQISSLIIGNNVVSIGEYAFANCTGMHDLTIPKATENIDVSAFMNVGDMEFIKVHKDNPNYMAENAVLYSKDGKTVIRFSLYCDLFGYGSALLNVEYIEDYALSGCNRLDNLHLSGDLISIGDYAFEGVEVLWAVYFHGSVDAWNNVTIGEGNDILSSAPVYCYSESEPTEEGNFWHYDSNGYIVIWGEKTV
jgi:hypothetical protein